MITQLSAQIATAIENRSLYGSSEAHLSNSAVHGQLHETRNLLSSPTQTTQWLSKGELDGFPRSIAFLDQTDSHSDLKAKHHPVLNTWKESIISPFRISETMQFSLPL
jgi:hypothetical protein